MSHRCPFCGRGCQTFQEQYTHTCNDNLKIAEKLIEASKIAREEMGCPDSIWIPDFGWVILNGEVQPGAREYLKSIGM